jgi:hypothetical protein
MQSKKARQMIMKIIERLDYDIYKSFLPDMCEDPEASEELMADMVEIVKRFTAPPRKVRPQTLAKRLVGKPIEKAEKLAKTHGLKPTRANVTDCCFRPERIRFEVDNSGKVVNATLG